MIRTISRLFAIAALSGTALFSGLSPALAAGNWTWTDVSDKIAERQNRPIWAMAYASPFWYLTDGQELWSGGHVWKTEGTVMADITMEIRAAGLSRVDDIVSDGQTVLFLKNTAPRNNIIEVVAFNGNYTNLTNTVRQNLSSGEGLVSITGFNGTWGIATSFGRVLLYTPSSNTLRTTQIQTTASQTYIQNHVSANNGANLNFAVQPISGNWLVYANTNSVGRFQKIDQYGNASTVSYPGNTGDRIMVMTSNGQSVLVAGYRQYGGSFAYVYNGTTFQTSSQIGMPTAWNSMLASWNGTSWLLLQEKNLYRFDGTTWESLGTTRDFFLTLASNGSGTFLLGGAESNSWSGMNPSYPLMLKLAKAQETYVSGTGSSVSNNNNSQTTNGTTFWTWTDPNQSWMRRDQAMTYNVGTWNTAGIKRIEIYANGSLRRTCELGRAYGNQACNATLYGGDYALGTSVAVNAKIVDGNDATVWTTLQYFNVTDSNGTGSNTASDMSVWTSMDPTGSSLNRNASATFRTQASATRGLSAIEVYVNGTLRRTCNFAQLMGTQSCDLSIYGGDYSNSSQLTLTAKAADSYGRTVWSDARLLSIQDTGSGNTANNTSWVWSEPEGTEIAKNANRIFRVGAWSNQGIRRIEIYVNGNLLRTCDLGYSVNANQQCSQYIYGSEYSQGTDIYANARITNGAGVTYWSDSKVYRVVAAGTATGGTTDIPTDLAGRISITSNRTNGYANNETITFTATAEDQDGVLSIEILVNAVLVKTCVNTKTCTYAGGPYNDRNTVSYGTRLIDGAGNALWTGYVTLSKR